MFLIIRKPNCFNSIVLTQLFVYSSYLALNWKLLNYNHPPSYILLEIEVSFVVQRAWIFSVIFKFYNIRHYLWSSVAVVAAKSRTKRRVRISVNAFWLKLDLRRNPFRWRIFQTIRPLRVQGFRHFRKVNSSKSFKTILHAYYSGNLVA